MKKNWIKLLAASLSLLLVFSSCDIMQGSESGSGGSSSGSQSSSSQGGADLQLPEIDTSKVVSFEEMEYVRPDGDAIVEQIKELTEKIKNAETFEEMLAFDEESGDILEDFYTMSSLAGLYNAQDLNNESYEEEKHYCTDMGVTLSVLNTELNRAIVEGPFAEEYKAHHGDYVYQSIENSLRLNSPETEELKQKREKLTTEYYKLSDEEMSFEIDGVEYVLDDIYSFESYEDRLNGLVQAYAQNSEKFFELYKEMIELDREIASILGFESPVEMYYLSYMRDYTPRQALEFCENAKEFAAPLVPYTNSLQMPVGSYSMTNVFKKMPEAFAALDPELASVWNMMIDYGLYDYEARAGKQQGAFTTSLGKFNAPFCFGNWSSTFGDVSTLIHEFGHFYDFWYHTDDDVVQNLDMAEIYSQGLELLMQENFVMITENESEANAAALDNLGSIVSAITYQAMIEEFQQIVYSMDDFTNQDLANLFAELLAEYGYGDYVLSDELGGDHTWVQILHIFDVPFYTISYSTSAFVASQFYIDSLEDHGKGVDSYMAMLKSDQNRPFLEIVSDAGIGSPFDKGEMEQLCNTFYGIFVEALGSAGAAA